MQGWAKAILILPFNVVVVIPFFLVCLSGYKFHINEPIYVTIGIILAILAFLLATRTMYLFDRIGRGTIGPWAPPKKLVVIGPFCYVRNPIITSVLMFLLAEYLIFDAAAILIWMIIFFIGHMIYFPLLEEKDLERRFGKDYQEDKKNVPRWLPRLTRWRQKSKNTA
jgi:protein-S-isoprenylcysteine O-methyltransferase Ste14